jgi:hypothetical protein
MLRGLASDKPVHTGTVWLCAALSLLLWLLGPGALGAATPPAKVVQQFIDAHVQGRFAEARGLTLERVDLSGSLFSGWLFGAGSAAGDMATADIFLSRKFTQVFRYTISGTTAHGDNQTSVSVVRVSPNMAHLYTWALAPKQGATPYVLIEAIDTYLTKVNFPVEESRMEFLLIRETGEWYISAIRDEKFLQVQQQWLPAQSVSAAPPPAGAVPVTPPGAGARVATVATTTTDNPGRQMADAQFNATLQSFNRPYQTPATSNAAPAQAEPKKPSLFSKVGRVLGFGGGTSEAVPVVAAPGLQETFNNIRNALGRYAASHNGAVPDHTTIYNWQTLRQLVNRHGKRPLPATEEEAGFRFVQYKPSREGNDYLLQVELLQPQDGVSRVEVTAYGIDRGK